MLKILLKKQLLEINKSFFFNSKTGARKSFLSSFSSILLFLLVLGLVAFSFGVTANQLCYPLVSQGLTWLYFAMMGSVSVFIGVIICAFSSYNTIYLAKDNDLLLSMPIKAQDILSSRLMSVYLMDVLYTAIVYIPILAVYFLSGTVSPLSVIFSILLFFVITLIVLTFSCILGFIIAKISVKAKNKTLVTLIASILFIVVYYVVYFKMNDVVLSVVTNGSAVANDVMSYAYPLYSMGKMAEGDIVQAIIFTGANILLLTAVFFVIELNFFKLVSIKNGARSGTSKIIYKQKSVSGALLHREAKKYFSSANVVLNSSISCIFLLPLGVLALIYSLNIRDVLSQLTAGLTIPINLLPFGIVLAISSMNNLTASSVSLEGKNIYLLQSLPVKAYDVLLSKIKLQVIITLPFVVFTEICFFIAFNTNVLICLLILIISAVFVIDCAFFGLFLNLKMPNLNWTNETVVVKQSMPVFLSLFSGFLFVGAFTALTVLIDKIIKTAYLSYIILLLMLAVVVALLIVFIRFTKTKGVKIFERL